MITISVAQGIQLFNDAGLEVETFANQFRILLNGVELNTYTGLHLLQSATWIIGEIRIIWYHQGEKDGIKLQQQTILNALGITIKS